MDCEPLHDIKGHAQNIIQELPALLDHSTRTKLNAVVTVDLHKEKKTGADYRLLIIHILALLRKNNSPEKVCQLLETLVAISHLIYIDDSKRTPKTILKLYNTTWLHFELVRELIPEPRHITKRKLFGIYIPRLLPTRLRA